MTKVAVLGASGRIARHVIDNLASQSGVALVLFMRDAGHAGEVPDNAEVVEGDALDVEAVARAVTGADIVYANLTGDDLDDQARSVIEAMDRSGVQRLVFIASLGIYDEVPGEFGNWNRRMIGEALRPFRRAADAIEASDLTYTIIRPAWLTDADEVDYELTQRDDPFKGTEVSRRSIAAVVTEIINAPDTHSNANIGVDKPGTEGPKPTFM